MQSAAPISVLLDNLAVPSKARSRSICFPGLALLASAETGWLPGSKRGMLQSSQQPMQLWLPERQSKNCRRATCQWGTFSPGRLHSGPQDAGHKQMQSGRGFQKRAQGLWPLSTGPRAGGAGSPWISPKPWWETRGSNPQRGQEAQPLSMLFQGHNGRARVG